MEREIKLGIPGWVMVVGETILVEKFIITRTVKKLDPVAGAGVYCDVVMYFHNLNGKETWCACKVNAKRFETYAEAAAMLTHTISLESDTVYQVEKIFVK